jgi:dTDP-4-amino-4,6-dideoxygalactose transaminase
LIPFFKQKVTNEMKDAVINALENEKFILGESVFKFEEEFAKYIGTKYAVAVNSGNSALQLSLIALGLGKNSKIITSTNSFIASANCILMVGGIPILTDINSSDGNMDISNVSEKSDGIIPVHIYGNPCDFESIKAKSEEEKIPIIEDACQAHGAEYNNKKVGSLGDVGCFSFYPTKNMTVGGDGGMVTTNNEDVAKTIISLRDNGRQTQSEHDKLGYTMRLNTINAAIGRVQLTQLDKMNDRRREIAQMYKKSIGEENFLIENSKGISVYHQIILKNKNRDKIIDCLKKNQIGYAIHYEIPIHKQPLYLSYGLNFPKSEDFCTKILSLPSHPLLTDENVKIVCETVNEVIL